MDQIIQTNCDFGAPMDCIRPMVQYFTDHRRSVLHVYNGVQREVFLEYLERASLYTVTRYVESATAGLSIRQEDRDLLIRYHKCVMVGIVLDWLDAQMNYDLLSACDRIVQLMDGSSKQAFLNCTEEIKTTSKLV
ncbi:MAG: TetR-like C-terminal domain-containing protein [Candidatus Onthomonas sp.]